MWVSRIALWVSRIALSAPGVMEGKSWTPTGVMDTHEWEIMDTHEWREEMWVSRIALSAPLNGVLKRPTQKSKF